jgi:hypothetical protein
MEYARLLIEIEVRRCYLATLEAERVALEGALSRFAVAVKDRIGGLKEEIRATRQKIDEVRRRLARLKADPDADPLEVERQVAEEMTAHEADEQAAARTFRRALGDDTDAVPPGWPNATERPRVDGQNAEILRLYRELAKRFHPDLARSPEERHRREAMMLKINVAYRDRDLSTLQALMLDAERVEATSPARLNRERLRWAFRELARLDREIAHVQARLDLLRRSDTYALWQSPSASDAALDDLEAKTQARLQRERDRLEEATLLYQRMVARRRRTELIRRRFVAATPNGRSAAANYVAPPASD